MSRAGAAVVSDLCRRFAEHLRGAPTSYDDVELDLDWATPLQRELVAAARAVPWGEVVSYGELAALAGRPGAARAAGSFCADNRYSLIIPCRGGERHRRLRERRSLAEAAAACARGGAALSAGRLADDVRAELAAIAPTRRCDRLAEVSALFHTAGAVHLRGRGSVSFHLDLASSAAARRAFQLLAELRVPAEIRTYASRSFERATRYQLHVEGSPHALETLTEAGVLDDGHRPLDRPPGRVVARSCCRGAYLRGAFLGGGSLTGPRSPHLEVRTPTPAGASFVRSVASAEEVRLRVSEREAHARAYAKGWEEIEGYLLAAGVVDAVLALEERSVIAEMRSEANRLANADHANLVRTARAAQRQLEAARRLKATGDLERLPEPLRQAALLRLRHPEMSLRDLAARASPAVTKASMQRRLTRVVEVGEA